MAEKKAKKKLYTLEEAMGLVTKTMKEMGTKEAHQRELKLAEEHGYNRAVKEMKDKLNKMMYL